MKADYTAEVIAICREAIAAGERPSSALMEHFNVDRKRAQTMLSVAKRRHSDHGLPDGRKGPDVGGLKYDRTLVFECAIAAFHRRERLAAALAARFGMSERTATQMLTQLRKHGWPIPYCPTAKHGTPSSARRCSCNKCQPTPAATIEPADTSSQNSVSLKVTVIGGGSVQLPESALPMGPWVADAACKGINTNLFYPERGEPTRHALEVCKPCVVKAECLQYAIDNSERWGIWGGMTERQRRQIRSDRYQARRNVG